MKRSLKLAVVLFVAVAAWAQENPVAAGAAPVGDGATSMVHAELAKTVDAKKAKAGDEIVAKTTTDFRTADGTRVPAGTKLVGRITEAQPEGNNGTQSRLVFAFERAVLKDKSEIPVAVAVQAVGAAVQAPPPPDMSMGAGASGPTMGGAGPAGQAPGVPGQTPGDAAPGAVGAPTGPGGDVAGSTAGTMDGNGRLTAQTQGVVGIEDVRMEPSGNDQAVVLTSEERNVKLRSGTQLVLRVRAR